MNAISGISTHAYQYVQTASQSKAASPAQVQHQAQPAQPVPAKHSNGDTNGSVGNNINTYA